MSGLIDERSLRAHLTRLFPHHRVVSHNPLSPRSVRITLADDGGETREIVWRVTPASELGHDRRADRAAATLLAADDFAGIPAHVRPLDVGAIDRDGALVSLRGCGEHYLITEYAPGTSYAEDLRRIACYGATTRDGERVDLLARYLANLHVPHADPMCYRRAIRDLVGGGDGVFGLVDSYPADVPGVSAERLQSIERRCVDWRWSLRDHDGRLCRTHGNFQPASVVFDGDHLAVIDASRGAIGDPADDLATMAIHYIVFALDAVVGWNGLGPLWHRFWRTYREARPDPSLTHVIPPFFAARALAAAHPKHASHLTAPARGALLGLVDAALEAGHFEPTWADDLFT